VGRPNLFVVGAAKAGTTSLWRYLSEHPEVAMSREKEPEFFRRGGDEAAYLALFGDAPVVGEASTSYLWHAPSADRIAAFAPGARIVVSLRDPVDRAWSSYRMWRRLGRETRSFAEVVRAELDAGLVERGRPSHHVGRSLYADSLRRYADRFEHVHVLLFDDLTARHGRVLRDAFLDVDTVPAARIASRLHNSDRLPRARALRPLLETETARVVGSRLPRSVTALAWRQPTGPSPDAATTALLEELYREDTREVEALLGRRLPWG
jgi:Sulfotransferase family